MHAAVPLSFACQYTQDIRQRSSSPSYKAIFRSHSQVNHELNWFGFGSGGEPQVSDVT
jgi:hypothetical protein